MTPVGGRIALAIVSFMLAGCGFSAATTSPPASAVPVAPTPTAEDHPSRSAQASPQPTLTTNPEPTRSLPPRPPGYATWLHEQAQLDLQRWAEAVGGASPNAVVFTSGLTRGGGWHGPKADDQKSAFLAGLIEVVGALPSETPPPAEIAWPDGSTTTVELFSAAQTLDDLVTTSQGEGSKCSGCPPLQVVDAHLERRITDTSHGPVAIPVWEYVFTDADTPLNPVTQVAVKDRVNLVLPPWDSSAPFAISMDSAIGAANSRDLTVGFVGARDPGDIACGADYEAEPVESDTAVVVIIHEYPHALPESCTAVGYGRNTSVILASPLGDRAVLEVQVGLPVSVVAPKIRSGG